MQEKENRFSIFADEELMRHVCRGEVQAFDELYARYSKRLMVYFFRMLNFDKALAEDALQDLFLKIAESPGKFDCSRSFRTWIFCIASNTCKNFYRHQLVRHRFAESQGEVGREYTSDADRPIARLHHLHFMNTLNQELAALPLEKREAFILRYQEDKTIAEIAEIQGCPEGSVKSRLHYTVRLLEEKLKIFNPINQ